jgi:putative nucleotidyltransferase with HDIG domain
LYLEGVHDGTLTPAEDDQSQVTVYDVRRQGGEIAARTVQSLEQALTYLRINLTAEGAPAGLTTALYRIFRSGIMPNIVYDEEASRERESEALRALQPVTVNIAGGQTLIEAGSRVTVAQAETLAAYRQHVLDRGDLARDETLRLAGRVLLVLAMVIACAFYVRLEDRETLQSNTRLGLLALVVILNLGLVRANYSLLDLGLLPPDSAWAAVLPFIAPTAIAPLIVAILIDAGSAIFMALLISIFTAVIYGNRMDLLVITFLASMVAIFCCRDARKRGNVVRAAATGGLTVAAFALLVGLVDRTPVDIIGRQMAAGLVTGIVTGVIVVGVIPILESLFQRTTDITLLELTDFNHPLLRLMQLEAPGTYHHSLVVAQLAENACSAIGANPLLARVCALFHDIGKTAKPAYFTENQRDGVNPHDASSPELSAELIKSHVSEGVELAHRHRLPRAVVDVIEQHHGTSLIRYFYHRALGGSRPPQGSAVPFPAAKAQAGGGPGPVSESDYRYDGPKPRFKESAVISLADCVEAASRSLRKPSPQGLSEMIDAIIRDRIADGQLDEAPLTFSELAQVKNSFTFTLLNMLHARVAYPEADAEGAPAGNASGSKT